MCLGTKTGNGVWRVACGAAGAFILCLRERGIAIDDYAASHSTSDEPAIRFGGGERLDASKHHIKRVANGNPPWFS